MVLPLNERMIGISFPFSHLQRSSPFLQATLDPLPEEGQLSIWAVELVSGRIECTENCDFSKLEIGYTYNFWQCLEWLFCLQRHEGFSCKRKGVTVSGWEEKKAWVHDWRMPSDCYIARIALMILPTSKNMRPISHQSLINTARRMMMYFRNGAPSSLHSYWSSIITIFLR